MFKRLAALLLCCLLCAAASAGELAKQLASDDSDEKITAIQTLLARGDAQAQATLKAMSDEALFVAGEQVFILDGEKAIDVESGKEITPMPEGAEGITLNNRVRRELEGAMATLALFDKDRSTRLKAARALQDGASPEMLGIIGRALAEEKDGEIHELLALAEAQASLHATDAAVRLKAVRTLAESSNPRVQPMLSALLQKNGDSFVEPDEKVRLEAKASRSARSCCSPHWALRSPTA